MTRSEAAAPDGDVVDVVVVGAGLAGLVAARHLDTAHTVVVVDKGRGVGGRLATRRIGAAVFDHGAQFFTAREPAFRELVAGWVATGVVETWFDRLPDAPDDAPTEARYRGAPAMTALAKDLASGLDVRTATAVASISGPGEDAGWRCELADGSWLRSRALVVTCPAPQSLALLDAGSTALAAVDRSALSAIAYDPCLAVLAPLAGHAGLLEPGGLQPEAPEIDWLADNERKGISPVPAVTVHASAAWSRAHWDDADQAVIAELLTIAGLASPVIEGAAQLMRWRYAKPTALHPAPCLVPTGLPGLVVAGDAFAGPRVEGAAQSGLAAARAVEDELARR